MKSMRKHISVFSLTVISLLQLILIQNVQAGDCDVHFVGNDFSVLETPDKTPVLQVLKREHEFRKAYNENLGFSKEDKWVLVELNDYDLCDKKFVFELAYPHLRNVQCYFLHENGTIQLKDIASGEGRRYDNRFAFLVNEPVSKIQNCCFF